MSTGIGTDQLLDHLDVAVGRMGELLADLGDELANVRPPVPGANTPYAIVRHCCAVMDWWVGAEIAGRPEQRDRDAEFAAHGQVAPLLDRLRRTRERLGRDLDGVDLDAPSAGTADHTGHSADQVRRVATAGGVLLHVYTELAQHLGHLEITADLLRADPRS